MNNRNLRLLRELDRHGAAAAPVPEPPTASATLLLDPFMVEYGDIVAGTTSPVASILYDGTTAEWVYAAADSTIIARVLFDRQITVVRPPRRLGMVRL